MRNLTWFEDGQPVDPGPIREVEARLGVKLPQDYVDFVQIHSGASNPDEAVFKYISEGREEIGSFGALISIDPSVRGNILEIISDLGDQISKSTVPIVETGYGDYVCLQYSDDRGCSISVYQHEKPFDRSMAFVAGTFSEFLDRLEVPDDDRFQA